MMKQSPFARCLSAWGWGRMGISRVRGVKEMMPGLRACVVVCVEWFVG